MYQIISTFPVHFRFMVVSFYISVLSVFCCALMLLIVLLIFLVLLLLLLDFFLIQKRYNIKANLASRVLLYSILRERECHT